LEWNKLAINLFLMIPLSPTPRGASIAS